MRTTATLLVWAVIVAGCSDGNPLREPGTGGSTGTSIVVPTEPASPFAPDDLGFVIRSTAFAHEGQIPSFHTRRDGDDVSPPLRWIGAPPDAVELALVVTDPNANGFVHWVIWGLDPFSTGIDTGQVPPGAFEAVNDFGDIGYGGPAPPEGESHLYLFQLFALGESALDIVAGGAGRATLQQLETLAIGVTELFASYP